MEMVATSTAVAVKVRSAMTTTSRYRMPDFHPDSAAGRSTNPRLNSSIAVQQIQNVNITQFLNVTL